jgi:hypothetical protein
VADAVLTAASRRSHGRLVTACRTARLSESGAPEGRAQLPSDDVDAVTAYVWGLSHHGRTLNCGAPRGSCAPRASESVRPSTCVAGRWAAPSNEEIVQLLARFYRGDEPSRPQSSTRPGLRRIFGIAIFWRNCSARTASADLASGTSFKVSQLGKLAFEFVSPLRDFLCDRGIDLGL